MSANSPAIIEKVSLYVVHRRRLLVYLQPEHPDILLQVPGGSRETGETLESAARRELAEETGITEVASVQFLQRHAYRFDAFGVSQIHQRHFMHVALEPASEPPEHWLHTEHHSSLGFGPTTFSLFWLDLDQASRDLAYDFAHAIPDLRAALSDHANRETAA